MNMKQSTLAVAVTAALALAASQQAAASVYAGSSLEFQNLLVNVTGAGLGTKVTSFSETATNTATLNGVSAPTMSATCGGTPGAPSGATNDCGPLGARLDPLTANAPGSVPFRATNAFALMGPGANQYSNSDSVIYQSSLTGDGSTHQQQIAESELQGGKTASANAEIKSSTGFTFKFTIVGGGGLALSFDTDSYLRAMINDPLFLNGNSQASMNATFSLTNDLTGDAVHWTPQGTAGNDCGVDAGLAGVTCVETADSVDLNRTLSVSTNGANAQYGAVGGPFDAFGISIAGLSDGDYTMALNAVTSTQLRRVPEPSVLALMGIGLLGLGVSARRKNSI